MPDYQTNGLGYSPVNPQAGMTSGADPLTTLLGGILGTAGAGQLGNAIGGVIPQQQGVLGNVNSLYKPQTGLGNGAFGALGSFLGLPGSAPFDPTTLNNFPGLSFLQKTGDQAINRQAMAMGTDYTPNTLYSLDQYNQGLGVTNALQPYLQTLLSSAGFGSTANQTLTGANLTTGNNIAQAMIGKGNANASGTAIGGGQILGGLGSTLFGGPNSSGVFGQGGPTNTFMNWLNGNSVNPASAALGGDITNNGADAAYNLGSQLGDIFGPSSASGEAAGAANASGVASAAAPGVGTAGVGGGSIGAAGLGPDLAGGASDIPLGAGAGAGGAAAGGFAGAGGDALGTTAAEQAGASFGGAGAGLGGALGAIGAVAAPLGILALGASSPPYTLNSGYYGRMNQGLLAGLAPGATPQQQFSAAQWLGFNGNAGAGFGPQQWQELAPYGITPKNIGAFATQLMRSSSQAIANGGGAGGGGYAAKV